MNALFQTQMVHIRYIKTIQYKIQNKKIYILQKGFEISISSIQSLLRDAYQSSDMCIEGYIQMYRILYRYGLEMFRPSLALLLCELRVQGHTLVTAPFVQACCVVIVV